MANAFALVLLLLLLLSVAVFAEELEAILPIPLSDRIPPSQVPPSHRCLICRAQCTHGRLCPSCSIVRICRKHCNELPRCPTPSRPPVNHPTRPSAKFPTNLQYPPTPPAPRYPPVHSFPRSFVAVQGVVYIKSCKYAGIDTLLGDTPVRGAIVKLQCNGTKYRLVQTAKTDKNGYFFLQVAKTNTTFAAHKCEVLLVSAPAGLKPSNLHGGVTGALLKPEKPYVSQKLPFILYTAGPLAFEPKCPR